MIYERDFKFGEGLRGEIEAAGAGYRAEREARVREAGDVYQRGTAIKLAEHQQRYPRAERQADGHAQEVSLNGDGVDILLLRAADRHHGRDNLVSGHDHHLTPERDGQLQPAAGKPESEKRRGRDDLQRRKNRNTYLVVLPKQAHGVETYTSTTDNTVVKYTAK